MRRRTLLTRVLIANLLLVSVAVVAAGVSANPNSSFRDDPAVGLILGFAIALTVLVNLFMIQKRFEPLERLIEAMEKADLARSGVDFGGLVDGRAETEEVERLEVAFRRMLERLDAERRRTSSAALQAMEEERARVARDLHDEVNQSLTGVLLHLEAARDKAPPELDRELVETKVMANQAMRELLDLARALRPTALDDMGLKAALAGAVKELGHQTSIETSFDSEGDFSDVGSEIQLVAYRVAQESLSNVVRHSGAEHVRVRLRRNGDGLELSVSDDGHGFVLGESDGGLGIPGMRERALLVGGELEVESKPPVGTRIRLRV
ncbi:MAG TPA: sensor histidine kinase [Solirubrobacterales bacterium]|nr:sensor histidine kinase [Solirubrobacterales bacterium]